MGQPLCPALTKPYHCMQFITKLPILILTLLCIASCSGQDNVKEYRFPQVGWTLKISTTENFLDSAQFEVISKNATDIINNTYNSDINLKELKPLFIIRQGQYNLIGSSINLFDTSAFESWQDSYFISKQILIKTITDLGPAVKILDTITSIEIIDNLQFEKLYVKTFYQSLNFTMHNYWYYRKQNDYDFSINISYVDPEIGAHFFEILRNSKFDK